MIKYCRCKTCQAIRKKHQADGTYNKWMKESKIINELGLSSNWTWKD